MRLNTLAEGGVIIDHNPPNTSDNLSNKVKHGLVILHTGEGKGKTTAALGLTMRALGHGLRVCVIQFIKSENGRLGEIKMAQTMGMEWHQTGDGFTWKSQDLDNSAALSIHGWDLAQQKIISGAYDLILLDEFTYPLHFGWLDTLEVINWLKADKPEKLHLVITGRNAPQTLIDYADLATEMKAIKHPFEQGVPGQKGIEF